MTLAFPQCGFVLPFLPVIQLDRRDQTLQYCPPRPSPTSRQAAEAQNSPAAVSADGQANFSHVVLNPGPRRGFLYLNKPVCNLGSEPNTKL